MHEGRLNSREEGMVGGEERTLALLVCGDGGAGCGDGSQNADGAWARDKTDKCECEGAASYM